ncbi:hypothetical protein I3843_04G133800 [Carya illinoinensis]|nr:hypothetical protein I3843_04G133800 [Carya illinoinensis]
MDDGNKNTSVVHKVFDGNSQRINLLFMGLIEVLHRHQQPTAYPVSLSLSALSLPTERAKINSPSMVFVWMVYGADLAAFLQTFAKIVEKPERLTF